MNPVIPPRYLSTEDRASDSENPAYLLWHQEDSLLFTRLLTTLSESVLPRVVKCVHAHDVWTVIDQFQRTQIYTKSRQLRYELRSMEKGDHTITQYLGRIQQIVDILKLIGDPVSRRNQLETIVDALPPEYQALALIIQYRNQPCELVVAETMRLSHEARLDRAPRSSSLESLIVNLTQGNLT